MAELLDWGRDDCPHHECKERFRSRLLATGLPDHIAVAVDRRVWVNGGCLWDQQGDDITVVDGSGLIGFIASGGRAAIAWRTAQGLRVTNAASPGGLSIIGARGIHLGLDWAVVCLLYTSPSPRDIS